jgi:hypothetical protein
MTIQDTKKFTIWMGLLGTAFGGKGLTKPQMDVYYEYLRDLDIDVIKEAVDQIINTRKYQSFPTVAEIREAALGGDAEAEDAALSAWSEATRLISAGRRSCDERINEVIKLAFGSWDRFGETDPEMEAADRKHFIRCYRAAWQRWRDERALNGGMTEPKRLMEKSNEGGRA